MALYDTLPVYKDVYALILLIYEVTKEFLREYKYTLWSSSENNDNNAWNQNFDDGNQNNNNKDNNNQCRCVRRWMK